jgi:hypothetical protein
MPYSETTSDEGRATYRAVFVAEQGEGLLTWLNVDLAPESVGIVGTDELFQAVIDALATVPGLTLSGAGSKTWRDYQDVTLTPDE